MKNYKDFDKVYIGYSDAASLILCSMDKVALLHFGGDDAYNAYLCHGDDVEIGAHYEIVFEGDTWLKIYDDRALTYDENHYSDGAFQKVTVYRAAERGCIIHWHN